MEERNRGGAKIAQLLKNTIYKIYRANQATGPRRSSDFAEEIEKLNGMIRFRVLTFSSFFFFKCATIHRETAIALLF